MKLFHGKNCLIMVSLVSLLFFSSNSREDIADTSRCGTPQSGTFNLARGIDTLKAVVIYACSTGVGSELLPSWFASIWDSSQQLSVPRYYKDNSLGKYIMTAQAFGRDSLHCFTSSYPVPDLVWPRFR